MTAMHDQHQFNQGLLEFLQAAPTPFHATTWMLHQLLQAGFVALNDGDAWQL